MLCFPVYGARLGHFYRQNEARKRFCPRPCFHLLSGALFLGIWRFLFKNAIFKRGLLLYVYSAAFFLGKYALFFCYVEWLAFSGFVSRYFWATENVNNLFGIIFGAVLLCFPAFGAS